MDRNCKKCIHHISGSCDAWECNMETLEDYRAKVIDEFAEKVVAELEHPNNYTIVAGHHYTTVDRAIEIVRKGE